MGLGRLRGLLHRIPVPEVPQPEKVIKLLTLALATVSAANQLRCVMAELRPRKAMPQFPVSLVVVEGHPRIVPGVDATALVSLSVEAQSQAEALTLASQQLRWLAERLHVKDIIGR